MAQYAPLPMIIGKKCYLFIHTYVSYKQHVEFVFSRIHIFGYAYKNRSDPDKKRLLISKVGSDSGFFSIGGGGGVSRTGSVFSTYRTETLFEMNNLFRRYFDQFGRVNCLHLEDEEELPPGLQLEVGYSAGIYIIHIKVVGGLNRCRGK